MIGAVLVPADFSTHSGLVMRFAAGLGEMGVRRVVVGHVVESSGLEGPIIAAKVDDARAKMQEMSAPIAAAGLELEVRIGTGEPERELLRLAASSGADAIVVGTHARSIPGEFFVGSVSERIARESVIPVMLVRYELLQNAAEPAELAWSFARKLLVATDFSPSAERALALAFEMPRKALGGVRLVTVAPGDLGEEEASAQLDAAAADARAKGLPVSCGVLRGAPERELLAEVDEIRASGVLVGTRGKHLLAEALVGSVSMAMARQASCPVLIVP